MITVLWDLWPYRHLCDPSTLKRPAKVEEIKKKSNVVVSQGRAMSVGKEDEKNGIRTDRMGSLPATVVIRGSAVDNALIKSSQIDTVTETLEAMRIRRQTGWSQMASHRSGGADDGFIADLAFGSGRGQVKR